MTGELNGKIRPGRETMKANRIILSLLPSTAMLSCQSEEDRKDEAIREELRNAIGVIEKTQQEHLDVQREFVKLHEKLKLKPSILETKTPAQREREKLEKAEKANGSRWQDDMRERIDDASSEELQRVAYEMRGIGEKADMGKTLTEYTKKGLRQRQQTPAKDRMP